MKTKYKILICAALSVIATAAIADDELKWGDLGDGTFANPVLNGDFSDVDVIRVGAKYYLTCSEFSYMGMPVLESDDMVNWKVIARVNDHIPAEGYDSMDKYGQGTWAPALRYHDGMFYIYVCSPHEGLWVTTATDPAGPWSEMKLIKTVDGWEDPCPFWDSEGNCYLGRSQLGGGPIIIHKMSPDGMEILDNGHTVYTGPTAEGTKFLEKDGYIYMSIPEGGVSTGWQKVLRATDIYGPYEGKICLEQGSTDVNGPHQGSLVDTPDGKWWFYHFQSTPVLGRVTHLQPVEWVDGFPLIGCDYDGNGVGEPMKIVPKPIEGVNNMPFGPQSSDDFNGEDIGVFWQYNHNPQKEKYSLTERPGWLRWQSSQATGIKRAPNQLSQKVMGYEGIVETCIDPSQMTNLQRAGISCFGRNSVGGGIQVVNGNYRPYVEVGGIITRMDAVSGDRIYIRLHLTPDNQHQFYVSTDGEQWTKIGEPFEQYEGDWKGMRVGLYNFCTSSEGGIVDFDYFKYDYDGPGTLHCESEGVDNVSAASAYSVTCSPDGVLVNGPSHSRVLIYNQDGITMAHGFANEEISLKEQGLYIAWVDNSTIKFVRK